MDFWKGTILGDISKHRDYEHGSVYEHLMDHAAVLGFRSEEGEELIDVIDYIEDDLEQDALDEIRAEAALLLEYWLMIDPITGMEHENPELYYALVITLDKKEYDYYIPAPGNGLVPNPKLIKETIDAYMDNYVEGRYELISEYL